MDQNYQPYDNQNHDPNQGGDGGYGQPPKKNSGLAIAGLVLGIVGIVSGFLIPLVGLICAIVGLVLSIQAKKQAASGMAKAGLICSIVGIALSVFAWACYAFALFSIAGLSNFY